MDSGNTSYCYSLKGDRKEDEILLEPLRYILQVPEKDLSITTFCHAFNSLLKISDDKLQMIIEILSMTVEWTLLLDDIQDNSILRRGIPTAHSVYGIRYTINTAFYLLFITLEKILKLHPMAIKVYLKELLEMYRGQGKEIFWRQNMLCPTENEYQAMGLQKCSAFFSLIRLMQLFSTNKKDFSSLIATFGLYFQIRDDYCDLCLDEYTVNKDYCEDITEGKFSFPIIHAIRANPDDRQILNILRQRTNNIHMKRLCVKLLEKYGSFKYTEDVLEELDSKMRTEIDSLTEGNPLLMKTLDDLKTWNTNKNYKNL